MKKWNIYRLVAILTALTFNQVFAQVQLIKTTQFNNFPSASSLTFFNNRLYMLGDDAPSMFVLNTNHEKIREITLFKTNEKRIDRNEKADIEASALYTRGNKSYLLGISSFSAPNRNKILVCNLSGSSAPAPSVLTTKNPLEKLSIEETNIEGATFANEKLLLVNRANNKHTTNYLVITDFDKKKRINTKNAKSIKLSLPQTEGVVGVSGLDYLKVNDMLLFVASTENTASAIEDGTIGESYIGYISNISKKFNQQTIKADTLLPFSKATNMHKTYKIESLAVESFKDNELLLHLAADNDDGKSTLFTLKWKIKEMTNNSNDK